MYGLETIKKMNRGKLRLKKIKYVPYDYSESEMMAMVRKTPDIREWDSIDIYDNGYKEITTCFVDSSGVGRDDERAMTSTRFYSVLRDILKEEKQDVYLGITDMGQFQVYCGVYKKIKKA